MVDKLVERLNGPVDAGIEEAWVVEAEKRLGEIVSGKLDSIFGDDVLSSIREKYRK